MKKFKYCFIGAGPANVFSVLYMIEHYKINPKDIAIFEKGKSAIDNDGTDLLHNFLGCSILSDGKLIRSIQEDLNIIQYLGVEQVEQYYDFILEKTYQFTPTPENITVTKPPKQDSNFMSKSKNWNAHLAVSEVHHLGSDLGLLFAQNIEKYLLSKGINLFLENEVVEVNNELNIINCNVGTYEYENLFIATGRANSKFVNNILKQNGIELKKSYLDIGCRFEIEYTDKIKEISDIQYDFKFKYELSTNENARTFCVCHGTSMVTVEEKDGKFKGFNGEGKGLNIPKDDPKWTNLTNFGILINLQDIDADEIMKIARSNKCQVLGDNFSFKSSVPVNDVQSKEYLINLPAGKQILEFIEHLKPILGFGENYKIHYPEIKEGSGKLQSNLKWQVPELPNIYFTGDSSMTMKDGGTRGIMPAAVSGMSAVDHCLQK